MEKKIYSKSDLKKKVFLIYIYIGYKKYYFGLTKPKTKKKMP